jgi:hypothetical protein
VVIDLFFISGNLFLLCSQDVRVFAPHRMKPHIVKVRPPKQKLGQQKQKLGHQKQKLGHQEQKLGHANCSDRKVRPLQKVKVRTTDVGPSCSVSLNKSESISCCTKHQLK